MEYCAHHISAVSYTHLSTDRTIFEKAFTARAEFVLAAKGIVKERSAKNMELPTGEVEIAVTELRVLAKSETPPFEIVENSNVRCV